MAHIEGDIFYFLRILMEKTQHIINIGNKGDKEKEKKKMQFKIY